jgi:hypothetical protein
LIVQYDDTLTVWDRQRAEQDCVHNAEDGGIGANTQRKGENDNGCETRTLAEHP